MKKMVFALIVILVFGAILLKDPIIKSAVTITASHVVGAPVHINSFSFGILKHAIRISGLKIYNPKDFPKGVLLDLPKVHVDYNLGNILKKKIHLTKVDVVLKDVVLVKNSKGELNVDSLKFVKQGKKTEDEKKAAQKFHIDLLTLDIGRIVYKDLTGEKPAIDVYQVGLKKSYKNISSPQQMATLILAESMKHTAIKGAAIYGLSSLAGVAFLPAGVAVMLAGSGAEQADFPQSLRVVYNASKKAISELGELVKESPETGVLQAKIKGCDVTVEIFAFGDSVRVKVTAKRFLMPRHETAGGLLYLISQKLQ